LFGDSFHPGGLKLTEELASKIELQKDDKVLDVACGIGTSSVFFAKKFECAVTGIDFSEKNINSAKKTSLEQGTHLLTDFRVGDAEQFDFKNNLFDTITCECSFCLFPDKLNSAKEMFRVLKKNGKIGFSDVVVRGELPEEMKNALFKFVCVLDAKSESDYKKILDEAGFKEIQFYDKKNEIEILLNEIKKRIFVAELAIGMGKIKLDVDIEKIKLILKQINDSVKSGLISYTMITAQK